MSLRMQAAEADAADTMRFALQEQSRDTFI